MNGVLGVFETGRGENTEIVKEVRLVVWLVREILLGGLVAIDHKSQVCVRIDLIIRDDVEEVNGGTSEGNVRIKRTVRRNPEIVMPGVVEALTGIGFQRASSTAWLCIPARGTRRSWVVGDM